MSGRPTRSENFCPRAWLRMRIRIVIFAASRILIRLETPEVSRPYRREAVPFGESQVSPRSITRSGSWVSAWCLDERVLGAISRGSNGCRMWWRLEYLPLQKRKGMVGVMEIMKTSHDLYTPNSRLGIIRKSHCSEKLVSQFGMMCYECQSRWAKYWKGRPQDKVHAGVLLCWTVAHNGSIDSKEILIWAMRFRGWPQFRIALEWSFWDSTRTIAYDVSIDCQLYPCFDLFGPGR